MEIMERAKELEAAGREIIYLCLGEPDFPTPEPIVKRACEAMQAGETRYTHSLGRIELRQALAEHYLKRYKVTVDPDQIIVSSGTSPLMLLLAATLCDPADEIILTDPGYSCYPNFIRFVGGKPRFLQTRPEQGFQPQPDEVRAMINDKTRALLINSPANPAGSILSRSELEALAELPIPLISDEIYHGLTYEGEEHSILEFTEEAFVLGGFSKAYAMTGWRLGYLIAPKSAVRALQTFHQNVVISANSFVQLAGVTALREGEPYVAEMRAEYDRRRRHLIPRLEEIGLKVHTRPVGAFYVLADARHISHDSLTLAKEILEATGVALTPGIDFGEGAEGFLRFSYANSMENLDKAVDRVADFFRLRNWL
ncbi:MAG: pyridoxal phosphate-dependent aminotransferase [Desulfuromonadales bacterium]|nr:pyridoxal phosphate-dependent aminotransferase [Desulfuromonadales bacterium]